MVRFGEKTRVFRWFNRLVPAVILGLTLCVTIYVIFEFNDRNFVLSRVPSPLKVVSIEYRLGKSLSAGPIHLPGDNETGFVIYRMTDASTAWAINQGDRLGDMLADGNTIWLPTPVNDRGDQNAVSKWHPYDHDLSMMSVQRTKLHPPTIQEYLEKYGFSIPIKKTRADEADRAIQSKGSFYSYGNGGSVTIVDPLNRKLYFAYAG